MGKFSFVGEVYSPFKFLDAYDREDKDIFFGRDEEIELLYETTFKTDLVLFYGQSGTGKTSLIRCGLANKFRESDWLDITIRRGDNINASLWKEIDRYSGTPVELETTIAEAIESLYTDFLRPVYLIFDQFEELFILGSKTEQEDFFKKVSFLLLSGAPCKLIFVMREEYIAYLHNFEKLVPGLFRNRIRIEPMYMTEVGKVIRGSAAAFGIHLDKDKPDETVRQIIENISDEEAGVQLPYLQVYLDRLYHEAVNTTVQSEKSPGRKNGKTKFTLELVKKTGPIGDVLGEFLNQQTLRIQGALTDRYPGAPPDAVWQVLNRFVTPEGTRMAMAKEKVYSTLQLERNLIDLCLEGLEKSRILRPADKGKTYELAHDTLAQRIHQNRSVEEKAISKCERLVITKFKTVTKNKKPPLLTGEELEIIAPYENKLRLEDEEKKFIEKSKEKVSRRKKRIVLSISAVILIILLAVFSLYQWNRTLRIKESLRLISEARDVVGKDPTLALRLAEASRNIWCGRIGRRIIYKIYSENTFYKVLVKLDKPFDSSASSPNGQFKFILTAHNDGTIRLWDREGNNCSEFQVPKKSDDQILCAAISPDNQYILIGLSDSGVLLWNLEKKEGKNFTNDDPKAKVQAVAFSPVGRKILTGWSDWKAYLQDFEDKSKTIFEGHRSYIRSVAFSPDGKFVLTGSDDDTARLWDLDGNEQKVFKGHKGDVHSVTFSSDGKIILTGSDDGTARLWDPGKGKKENKNEINSFEGYGQIRQVTFLPDNRYILICSTDIHLLDTAGNQLLVLKGHEELIQSLVFLEDSRTILTCSADQTIRSWQLNGGELKALQGHDAAVYCAAFSPDGKYILTGSWDETAILWAAKGNQLATLSGHTGVVHSLAFSPDSKYILTGAWDETARLWDLQGNQLKILSGHKGQVRSVAFSSDGQYILTGTYSVVRIWDKEGGQIREFAAGGKTWFTSAAFSPTDNYIVIGSGDRIARLWDLEGKQPQDFVGHEGEVTAVTFSPDGKHILTGSSDKTVRLWDLKGKKLNVYKGYTSDIQSLAFSPDGKYILAACENIASLRDLDGNEFQVFNGYRAKIFSAAFSPGGQYVVTACADKIARLWNVKMPLEDFLKTGNFEKLSTAQKQKYGIKD